MLRLLPRSSDAAEKTRDMQFTISEIQLFVFINVGTLCRLSALEIYSLKWVQYSRPLSKCHNHNVTEYSRYWGHGVGKGTKYKGSGHKNVNGENSNRSGSCFLSDSAYAKPGSNSGRRLGGQLCPRGYFNTPVTPQFWNYTPKYYG